MKRGINIGCHFELTPESGVKTPNPMRDWYYEIIPELGFDHVRLPVKWSSYTDDENNFKIEGYFLEMVQDSIDRFLEKNLEVVLNIHHFREAMDDPKGNEDKIYSIWEQLAEHFKDYPDSLIFEVMNEPTWKTTSEIWNEVQNKAVAVIRKTNPTRRIMIGGIDYTGLFALNDLVPPEDTSNLIASFHYYFPLDFTHQGASWSPTYKDVKGIKWSGTPEEVEDIRKGIFENAKAWSDKYGIPMNLGEFGALNTADMESRVKYTRCVRETCEEFGISWSYWEFNRGFGICDKETDEFHQPLVDALLKDSPR